METVYEGTWEEIAAHREEFGERRLRLIVPEGADEAAIRERRERLERGIAEIERLGRGKGPYPNVVMDNDFLYPGDEERA